MKILSVFLISGILFLILSSKGYSQDTKLTDDQLKTCILKVYDAFNKGDYSNLGDYIDANLVEHSPSPGQKPGLAGLEEMMDGLRKGFPDLKFTLNDVIISGDKASALFTFTGTNSGEMMNMKPTGKKVDVQGIDYMYFKNGKCTEHWGYIDTDKWMAQMGYNQDQK
jgi:predicted ester cyclase